MVRKGNLMVYMNLDIIDGMKAKYGRKTSNTIEQLCIHALQIETPNGNKILQMEEELKKRELQLAKDKTENDNLRIAINQAKEQQDKEIEDLRIKKQEKENILNTCFMCSNKLGTTNLMSYKGLKYHFKCHDKKNLEERYSAFVEKHNLFDDL